MVETLATVFVLGVTAAAVITLFTSARNQSSTAEKQQVFAQIRREALQIINSNYSMSASLSNNDNFTKLRCFYEKFSCKSAPGTGTLSLDRGDGNFIARTSSVAPNFGFDIKGKPCQGFSNQIENSSCPYRLEVKYSLVCDDSKCFHPLLKIDGEIQKAQNSSTRANLSQYSFSASRQRTDRICDPSETLGAASRVTLTTVEGASYRNGHILDSLVIGNHLYSGYIRKGGGFFSSKSRPQIRIFDISNPSAPNDVAIISSFTSLSLPGGSQSIKMANKGNSLFVASYNDILEVDVSNPTSPNTTYRTNHSQMPPGISPTDISALVPSANPHEVVIVSGGRQNISVFDLAAGDHGLIVYNHNVTDTMDGPIQDVISVDGGTNILVMTENSIYKLTTSGDESGNPASLPTRVASNPNAGSDPFHSFVQTTPGKSLVISQNQVVEFDSGGGYTFGTAEPHKTQLNTTNVKKNFGTIDPTTNRAVVVGPDWMKIFDTSGTLTELDHISSGRFPASVPVRYNNEGVAYSGHQIYMTEYDSLGVGLKGLKDCSP